MGLKKHSVFMVKTHATFFIKSLKYNFLVIVINDKLISPFLPLKYILENISLGQTLPC